MFLCCDSQALQHHSASHLAGGPRHARSVHVLFLRRHYLELLLLPNLLGQNSDLLHLLVLALIIRVVLAGSLFQVLLLLQFLKFLSEDVNKRRLGGRTLEEDNAEQIIRMQLHASIWYSKIKMIKYNRHAHLHDARINVICDIVALPDLGDLILLLLFVHQIPVF